MREQIFIFILLIHFLADFGLQTHEQANNKSSSWKWLLYHTGVYSAVWFIATLIFLTPFKAFEFAFITWCTHTIVDYSTSRIGKSFWEKKDLHNGFVVVGFDQMLHYLQLYYTFKLLI